MAGQQVNASIEVINMGGIEGSYEAILKIDDVEIEREVVTVSPETTEIITFAFVRHLPGNYNVEIGGISRILVVRTVEPEYNLSNRRLCRIRFSNTARNEGPGSLSELHGWLIVPRETLAQKVISFDIEPEPSAYLFDEWGQKIAYYKLQDVAPGTEFTVVWTVEAELYDIKYDIDPSRVGSFEEVPAEIKSEYTVDEKNYNIHSLKIQEAAKQAVGDEKNPYYMVKKIHDYVMEHLQYKFEEGWDDAATVLTRGDGSCSEYTYLFIALCRANGIPARFIGGTVYRGTGGQYEDSIFHRIAEVYFPNYGWIPIDTTWDDSQKVDK